MLLENAKWFLVSQLKVPLSTPIFGRKIVFFDPWHKIESIKIMVMSEHQNTFVSFFGRGELYLDGRFSSSFYIHPLSHNNKKGILL